MGNRGSKSVTSLSLNKPQTVKEQRVDGSRCIKPVQNKKLMHLRCTLMGCESSYPVKIPSKQLNRFIFLRLVV